MEQTKIKLSALVISWRLFQEFCEKHNIHCLSIIEFHIELNKCNSYDKLRLLVGNAVESFTDLLEEFLHTTPEVLQEFFMYTIDELTKIYQAINTNYTGFVDLLIDMNSLKITDPNTFSIPSMVYTEYYNRLIENEQVIKRLKEYGVTFRELIPHKLWIMDNLFILGAGLNGIVYRIGVDGHYTFKVTGNRDEYIAAGKIMKMQQVLINDYNFVNTIFEVFSNNTNAINPLLDIEEKVVQPLQSYFIVSNILEDISQNDLKLMFEIEKDRAKFLNDEVVKMRQLGFVDLPHIAFNADNTIDWNNSYCNNLLWSTVHQELKIHDIMWNANSSTEATIGAYTTDESREVAKQEIIDGINFESDIDILTNMLCNTKLDYDCYQNEYNEVIDTNNKIDRSRYNPFYHCSPANFSEFDINYIGSNIGSDNGGYGFYLTQNLFQALQYGNNVYHVDFTPVGDCLSSFKNEIDKDEWMKIVSNFTELLSEYLGNLDSDQVISDSMIFDILLFESSVPDLLDTIDSYTDLIIVTNMINIINDVLVNNNILSVDNSCQIVNLIYEALFNVSNKSYTIINHDATTMNVVCFYAPEIIDINVF